MFMKKDSENSSISSRGPENWTVSSILKKASSYITRLAKEKDRSILATINSNSDENLESIDEETLSNIPERGSYKQRNSPENLKRMSIEDRKNNLRAKRRESTILVSKPDDGVQNGGCDNKLSKNLSINEAFLNGMESKSRNMVNLSLRVPSPQLGGNSQERNSNRSLGNFSNFSHSP